MNTTKSIKDEVVKITTNYIIIKNNSQETFDFYKKIVIYC